MCSCFTHVITKKGKGEERERQRDREKERKGKRERRRKSGIRHRKERNPVAKLECGFGVWLGPNWSPRQAELRCRPLGN